MSTPWKYTFVFSLPATTWDLRIRYRASSRTWMDDVASRNAFLERLRPAAPGGWPEAWVELMTIRESDVAELLKRSDRAVSSEAAR